MSVSIERAKQINQHLNSLGAKVYLSCIRKTSRTGKVTIFGEWKQISEISCDTNYPDINSISESQARNYLKKNLSIDIKTLYDDKALLQIAKGNSVLNLPKIRTELPKATEKEVKTKVPGPIQKKVIEKEKVKLNPKLIIYGDKTVIDSSEEIQAEYGIIELSNLTPSNDGITFYKNENYPQECQTRDYSLKTEQNKVLINAKEFDSKFLINDIPHPADGTPIIDITGIVYGGNSRTMVLERVAKYYDYNELYTKDLIKKASFFGFTEEQVKNFKNPVLVRVIPVPKNCAYLSLALQSNKTQDFDPITNAIAISKQFNNDLVDSISNIFESREIETFSELYRNQNAQNDILKLLRKSNIITDTNLSKWFTGNEFNSTGKELLQNSLLAIILPSKELLTGAKSFTNTIAYALPQLVQIKRLDDKYNFIPLIYKAIELESKRRANGLDFEMFLAQFSMFDKPADEETLMIYRALAKNKPRLFKSFALSYLESANNAKNGTSMFETNDDPMDIAKSLLKSRGLEDLVEEFNAIDDYALPKLPSLSDVINKTWKAKRVKLNRTEYLLNGLLDNAKILVKGNKGAGKSTFALHLIDDLSKQGEVLFVSAEEKADQRLKERLLRNRVRPKSVSILNSREWGVIKEFIDSGKYNFILIDSHNELTDVTQKQLLEYIKTKGDLLFVIITRMSKNGKDILGSSNFEYDVDTVIRVNDGVATTEKHRDGVSGKSIRVLRKDYSHLAQL